MKEQIREICKALLDSIADSVFVKIGGVGQILIIVSEQKIPITILILKRGPCLIFG